MSIAHYRVSTDRQFSECLQANPPGGGFACRQFRIVLFQVFYAPRYRKPRNVRNAAYKQAIPMIIGAEKAASMLLTCGSLCRKAPFYHGWRVTYHGMPMVL